MLFLEGKKAKKIGLVKGIKMDKNTMIIICC
jgi:hypothetical protein